ncbi:WYL domain-containing protein [Ruminococcus sp.]|uniref:helix-turn-helix transcriptional regulator n=1 Tax=Ruminococcus sp. TaxID=41978 RepID=UPI0025F2D504|nr:WYL domain-containing protein [Ruminococcus sp.]
MAAKEPKKLAIFYILKAPENHSCYEKRYSQSQIIDLVYDDYGMKLDRKTIRHNLSMLIEAGFPLKYEEHHRTNKKGQQENILTNWYYEHEQKFDDSELQIMIDSLIFSNFLPQTHCRDIVKKIAELGSEGSRKTLERSYDSVHQRPVNKQMFYTVSILSEAISLRKKVTFSYCDYDTDLKFHPRLNDNKTPGLYSVSPYKLMSINGRYYMLGKNDSHDSLSTFRIDRIKDIFLTEQNAVSVRSVKGCENGIDLAEFAVFHPNMWGGDYAPVRSSARDILWMI